MRPSLYCTSFRQLPLALASAFVFAMPLALTAQTTTQTTNCNVWGNNVTCQSYSETQKDFWTSFQEGMARTAYIRAAQSAAALAQSQMANAQSAEIAAATRAQADQFERLLANLQSDSLQPQEPHLPLVNQHLALDFSKADRVELRTKSDGGGGSRRDLTRRYVLTRGISGEEYVEAAYVGKYTYRQGFRSRDVIEESGSSRLRLSPFNSFTSGMHQRALVPELADRFSATILVGEHAIVSTSALSNAVAVPNGIIPTQLLRQAFLALPDTLPLELRFWVLDEGTGRVTEAQMSRVDVLNRRVPISSSGHSCEEPTPTVYSQRLDVARYSVLIGATRVDYFMLARPPHIAWLTSEDLSCVGAPAWQHP